ncbi:MAG: hypothetical protein V7L23_10120 [Nostoc sp.]|uniref:hypothetical protein n=1 Tax=Nostoc sp. TaxID=1180 RepID=UPI002FEE7971
MKPSWRTGIILTAIAGATIIAILIFQKTNQPSIALTEELLKSGLAKTGVTTIDHDDKKICEKLRKGDFNYVTHLLKVADIVFYNIVLFNVLTLNLNKFWHK